MLRTIGVALRSSWPALLGLAACAGVLLLAIWLPNLELIWGVITSGSMAPLAKAGFLWSSLGAIQTNFTTTGAWLTAAVAVLAGLNVTVAARYVAQRAAAARAGGAGLGGILLALIGAGCSSCGAVVLSALLGTGAAATAVARLPLGGQEFTILSVVVLAATLAVTARKASRPAACPPGPRPDQAPAPRPAPPAQTRSEVQR